LKEVKRLRNGKIYLISLLLLFSCYPYGIYHKIEKGETIYTISKTYNVDMKEIIHINNIKEPEKIKEGQVIFIPGVKETKPESPKISDKKDTKKVEKIDERQTKINECAGKGCQFKPIWPVEGSITSNFGLRDGVPHDGIDIQAKEGTPIKSAENGNVIYSGNELKGYGNLIIIKHNAEYVTVYAHNEVNLVKDGDVVKKGDIIGRVGKSGRASNPHLHFEIRWKAKPVNPLLYLPH